jgi:hypothetical protein
MNDEFYSLTSILARESDPETTLLLTEDALFTQILIPLIADQDAN